MLQNVHMTAKHTVVLLVANLKFALSI